MINMIYFDKMPKTGNLHGWLHEYIWRERVYIKDSSDQPTVACI